MGSKFLRCVVARNCLSRQDVTHSSNGLEPSLTVHPTRRQIVAVDIPLVTFAERTLDNVGGVKLSPLYVLMNELSCSMRCHQGTLLFALSIVLF